MNKELLVVHELEVVLDFGVLVMLEGARDAIQQ